MADQRRVRAGGLMLSVAVRPARAAAGRPAAVLLPGTGATARDWDVVAEELSRERTTYAVDLRGHGASDRPGRYSIDLMAADVLALLAELDEPLVDIVGHSLGGLVALRVAARGRGIRRLVLEDVGMPHPRRPTPPSRPDGDLPFDWAVVEQVRPEIDDPAPDWPDVVAALRLPTLVVAGGPRSFVPGEHVAELVDRLRDARLTTIDTGHEVHATDPEAFVREVRAFLDG